MRFAFGDFTLDTDRRELTRGAELISVGPKVFDLLVYLIENRERVVSKDELLEAVWGGRIVSDSTLASNINAMRKAVGDTGDKRNFVRTLARKGFRFVGAITACQTPAAEMPLIPAVGTVGERDTQSELPDKPSIAVIPFENLSGDPEQDYFSDGVAEDLITDLSKISGLFVIARNSSFAFRGKAVDVKVIAKSLGVRHILEGSVRKMGSRLRVNAQLVDAADGGHIWAERYDGNLDDIFEFQDDIREQIVSALRLSLSPTDRSLAARKPTDSAEAYDLFLKGRAHYHRFTPEYLLEAAKCFEKAIEIDPNFAAAYGYLSYCYFQGWATMWPGFDDNLDRALELAERGVALDRTSAIALTRLGWIQNFLRRYDQAIANLEKALALAPENAEVNATLAMVLNYLGNPERGLQLLEKALNLEMFAPPNWQVRMGISFLLLGQYDEALARLERAIEPPSRFYHAYICMAWTYAELDRIDEAKSAIKALLEIIPHYTVTLAKKFYVFRIDELRDRLLDALRKAGLPEG